MAFRTLGIGGVLTFSTKAAVRSLKRAHVAFIRMEQKVDMLAPHAIRARVGFTAAMRGMGFAAKFAGRAVLWYAVKAKMAMRSVGRIVKRVALAGAAQLKILGAAAAQAGTAFRALALGLLPLVAGVGFATKTAASFEKQMSGVQAVLGPRGTAGTMRVLAKEARRMGIESVFSATQAGEAMEYMARAGFGASQILSGLEGVMHAAAAEGIGLGEAADIVASNVRAFGLAASDTTRVADVLAVASASANTNIRSLAEGLKFAAPIAKMLGMEIEETTATLALLADSGIKGTLAGTALKNAMLKLAAPTGKGAKRLKQLGLIVQDAKGNFVGMESILHQLRTGLNKMKGPVDRTAAAAELFGLRGVALTSLLGRLDKKAGDTTMTFSELKTALENADGAAKRMAEVRLSNLAGKLTLLKSSLEAFAILTFEGLLKPMASSFEGLTSSINSVLYVIQDLKEATETGADVEATAARATKKHGSAAVAVARGVLDAIKKMKEGWKTLTGWIRSAGESIEKHFGKKGLRALTKFMIAGSATVAALAPIAIAVTLIGWLLKSTLVPAIKMVGLAFKFALSPVGLIVLAIVAVFLALRRENESLFSSLKRVWEGIKSVVMGVWNFLDATVIALFRGLFKKMHEIGQGIKQVFGAIGRFFSTTFGWILGDSKKTTHFMKGYFSDLGSHIGNMLILVLKGFATVFTALDDWIHDSRSTLQTMIAASEREWYKHKLAIGAISQKEFEKEMQRISRIGSMIQEDRKRRARFVKEREAELEGLAKLRETVTETRAAPGRAEPERKLEVKLPPQPEQTINVKSTLNVDGREVATAVTRHTAEVMERAGARAVRWQRRAALEFGAIDLSPAKAGGTV